MALCWLRRLKRCVTIDVKTLTIMMISFQLFSMQKKWNIFIFESSEDNYVSLWDGIWV